MSAKWIKTIAIVAIAGLISAGAVLAQAPDQEGGRGKQAMRGRRGDRPQMTEEHRNAMRNIMKFAGLLGHEGATIQNTDKGIDVTITTDGDVDELQQNVQEAVDALADAAAQMPERPGKGRNADRAAHLPMLLMQGDATASARNTDQGVVVSINSDDAAVVEKIQRSAPEWKERAQKMHKMRDRMRKRHEAHEILSQENVTIKTVETDGGVVVTVTSADPETQAKLQELLPEFFESMGEMRRDRERDGAGRRGDGDKGAGRDRGRRRGRGNVEKETDAG
jgi:hypothetical protein